MGPLEVRRSAQLVKITPPKQRIILASLLLQPGSDLAAGEAGAAVAVARAALSAMDTDAFARVRTRAQLLIDKASRQAS
ncbi:hypothetical protein [Asanoa sp. NPDC050611]|uniref:hypothetical protein n=1 Tax=Asanoa sp. NPDC050611 TaxID=3157098 RepID=UPI0033D1C032